MQKQIITVFLVCIVSILTSCAGSPESYKSTPGNISEEPSPEILELPSNTSLANTNLTGEVEYIVDEVQLKYVHNSTEILFPGLEFSAYPMEEKRIQLNQILKNTMLEWVTDDCSWLSDSKIEVVYKSEDYLSIKRISESWGNRNDTLNNYITININDSTRVSLDDLLPDNAELVSLLKSNFSVFSNWSDEKLDSFLQDVNSSESEYLSNSKAPSAFSALLFKPGFYISDEIVYIKRNEVEADDIAIFDLGQKCWTHGDGSLS